MRREDGRKWEDREWEGRMDHPLGGRVQYRSTGINRLRLHSSDGIEWNGNREQQGNNTSLGNILGVF